MLKRVVITGIGALTPLGNNVKSFWSNIVAGKSGAEKITRFDASEFRTRFACELKDFDAKDYLEKSEIKRYVVGDDFHSSRPLSLLNSVKLAFHLAAAL